MGAARLDLDVVHLRTGPTLLRARRVRSAAHARDLVTCLKRDGALDRAVLERDVELAAPPLPLDATFMATAHRDLRVLADPSLLDAARRHRRAFTRYGRIDGAWIEERQARLRALHRSCAPERWSDSIVELVRAMRDDGEATTIARAFASLRALPAERRAEAERRALAIAAGETGDDEELARLAERLDAARELPGRARRRRTLDVLRQALRWPLLPAELVTDDFLASAAAALRVLPLESDEAAEERLALVALSFRAGEGGVPALDDVKPEVVLAYTTSDLTLAQACALSRHDFNGYQRNKIGHLVANGLELELVAAMVERDLEDQLAALEDVRAARAFATWSIRLAEHGVQLTLKPELFESLPKNEDLAVLTLCLLDAPAEGTDPLATLDATLGLFQRLPAKARGILGRLRGIEPGAGRRAEPAFAAWLDDDATLDRAVHLARLAGERPLSHAIREDFEHAARRAGERRHLERLAARTELQARRLEALRSEERIRAETPRARTLRRLRARIEQLFPIAYRRELDATFRQVLAEGWGIAAPALTPAWRDAVRFWLNVDDNRKMLEKLLREAAKTPGRSVVREFARSRRWIRQNAGKIDVDAWLAPRRMEVRAGGARFVLALEEDPLEVLRMGIPFGTCLALDDGSNAASTVLNAIEANKRVLYVRNASGNVVARKLIGITPEHTLVGYRLYSSVGAEEDRAIRAAVSAICAEIARAVRVPLASKGRPAQLYDRLFWYDDGEVAFEPAADALGPYCAALGLATPPKPDDTTLVEAERWRAREAGDVPAALALLDGSCETPEGRVHEEWVAARLGIRRGVVHARNDVNVAHALFDALARDEDGMLRALDVAARLPERQSDHRLAPLLARFPSSPKIGVALVDLALRSMRYEWARDHGHAHLTLTELPRHFEDVTGALDLLDAIAPAWRWLSSRIPACKDCVVKGVAAAIDALEETFERAPDPSVVVAALMSRHRTRIAHRAALRVAAAHVLPGGRRALQRFAALRPDLVSSADGVAALVRQAAIERVTPAFAKRVPPPREAPFESLRDLVVLPGIELLLGRWATPAAEPAQGPWEEAWRRRRGGATPAVGRDSVDLDRARRELLADETPPAERANARALILSSPDGGPSHWVRLLAACARRGDALTAERILETKLPRSCAFPARVLVDLWSLGDETLRAAVVATLARPKERHWHARVCAAEREARARGTSVGGLRERVALALVEAGAPSDAITSLVTIEHVRAVLAHVVAHAAPENAAAAYAYLEDPLSVCAYRDVLAAEPPERREAIFVAIRKLERSSPRSRTFFAWLSSCER
ncbi:MAG: hypothetical protein KF837_31685 [Labilithrix sp.]|nr:hypothetical protein [Labilithrix sp.]